MSEYLNKKAVLEFIKARKAKFAGSYKDIEYGAYMELETIDAYIESGVFDVTLKGVEEYYSLQYKHGQAQQEIQRLRAALEMAKSELRWGDPTNAIERVERIIDEALSTTTEPINAGKVKRIECPCCGCEISIKPKTELLKGEETA